ncbi:MAG: CNNM domain-containing protein [Phycisphaerales bacterium]|nr:CNNM domain-containing protein [Phycisphaerales bacterium]
MTPLMTGVFILLAVVGLIGSAFYSGMEIGLYTINRVRLTVRAGHGDPSAAWLLHLVQRPATMLTVLLLGNNIANYLSSFGIAGLLDAAGVSPIGAIAINAGILIPLLFIFGEVLPKDLFRTQTDRWSYRCVGLLQWTSRALLLIGLLPLVTVVTRLFGQGDRSSSLAESRQRLGRLFKEGMGAGVLSESQSTLLDRALAMRHVPVTGEMVPWSQVCCLAADLTGDVRLDAIRGQRHTYLPVTEPDGSVIGVVSALDILLDSDRPTRTLLQPPLHISDSLTIPAAMERLRSEQRGMAIIDDRQGRPCGIVTVKDLAEVLTGDLE